VRTRSRLRTGACAIAPASLVAALLLLGACGGSDADERDMRVDAGAAMDTTPAGTPAPPSLPALASEAQRNASVTLDEWSLRVDRDGLAAGDVTFRVMNVGESPHVLAVAGADVSARTPAIEPGGTQSLTVTLGPGTYRLACPDSADGASHAGRGMSAPFVVR
jgi:hypothetical protein